MNAAVNMDGQTPAGLCSALWDACGPGISGSCGDVLQHCFQDVKTVNVSLLSFPNWWKNNLHFPKAVLNILRILKLWICVHVCILARKCLC